MSEAREPIPQDEKPLSVSEAWGAGKLILFGEHAVVYNQPAVAVALNRGLKVTIRSLTSSNSTSNVQASLCSEGRLGRLAPTEAKALITALNQGVEWIISQGAKLRGELSFTVSGALPFKVGLGSSAALSVASLRALAGLSSLQLDDHSLFEGAMEMERVFHQTPSGLDHQVSISGGALCFRRTGGDFSHRSVTLSQPLHIALTWIPRQGSTASAVRGVAERRQQDPAKYNTLFSEIGELTALGIKALECGDLESLGSLLIENHQRLRSMGVSIDELDKRCAEMMRSGALGAKMSGAGHGGTCFGLFAEQRQAERAASTLLSRGISALAISLGPPI